MPRENDVIWLEVVNVRGTRGSELEVPRTAGSTSNPAKNTSESGKEKGDDANDSLELEVQLKADRADKEPTWRPVHKHAGGDNKEATLKTIYDGLDNREKRRIVLAGLAVDDSRTGLCCRWIRVQSGEPSSR